MSTPNNCPTCPGTKTVPFEGPGDFARPFIGTNFPAGTPCSSGQCRTLQEYAPTFASAGPPFALLGSEQKQDDGGSESESGNGNDSETNETGSVSNENESSLGSAKNAEVAKASDNKKKKDKKRHNNHKKRDGKQHDRHRKSHQRQQKQAPSDHHRHRHHSKNNKNGRKQDADENREKNISDDEGTESKTHNKNDKNSKGKSSSRRYHRRCRRKCNDSDSTGSGSSSSYSSRSDCASSTSSFSSACSSSSASSSSSRSNCSSSSSSSTSTSTCSSFCGKDKECEPMACGIFPTILTAGTPTEVFPAPCEFRQPFPCSKEWYKQRNTSALFVSANSGIQFTFSPSEVYVLKASARDTQGAAEFAEVYCAPGFQSLFAAATNSDAIIHVSEGTFNYRIGPNLSGTLSVGGLISVQRGTPYGLTKSSPGPGILLVAYAPPGTLGYYAETAIRRAPGTSLCDSLPPFDLALARKFGIKSAYEADFFSFTYCQPLKELEECKPAPIPLPPFPCPPQPLPGILPYPAPTSAVVVSSTPYPEFPALQHHRRPVLPFRNPIVLQPGDGPTYTLGGTFDPVWTLKVGSADTCNGAEVVSLVLDPGTPPVSGRFANVALAIYCTEGNGYVSIGNNVTQRPIVPRDFVYVPAGQAFSLAAVPGSTGPAAFLIFFLPGAGFGYFRGLIALTIAGTATPQAIAALQAQFCYDDPLAAIVPVTPTPLAVQTVHATVPAQLPLPVSVASVTGGFASRAALALPTNSNARTGAPTTVAFAAAAAAAAVAAKSKSGGVAHANDAKSKTTKSKKNRATKASSTNSVKDNAKANAKAKAAAAAAAAARSSPMFPIIATSSHFNAAAVAITSNDSAAIAAVAAARNKTSKSKRH